MKDTSINIGALDIIIVLLALPIFVIVCIVDEALLRLSTNHNKKERRL